MLKRVRIQNFLSLADVTVDLAPLSVLIGRSGTGKSNFVRATRFLRDSLRTRSFNFDGLGGIKRVLNVDHPMVKVSWDVQFRIRGHDQEFRYILRVSPEGGAVDEYFRAGGNDIFHHESNKWIVAPDVAANTKPQGIMLGAIPGLQESTFAHVALTAGIGCYDFPGTVLALPGNDRLEHELVDTGEKYLSVAQRILSDMAKAPVGGGFPRA